MTFEVTVTSRPDLGPCPDCGDREGVELYEGGPRGPHVACSCCGAGWLTDAIWLDKLFVEPGQLLADLPEWMRPSGDAR